MVLLFIHVDVILPVLNSSVDSPIATASCVSTQQRTGSDDFELQDVLEDVSGSEFSVLHYYTQYAQCLVMYQEISSFCFLSQNLTACGIIPI